MQSVFPALALAVAVMLYGANFAGAYGQDLLITAGFYAIATIGYQLVFGRVGTLSLAQGFFFGLGAYVTGIAATTSGLGFAASFPLSILAAVIVAALVAVPVLRLESHYFALATLGIAQLGFLVAVNWEDVTGGANGIYGVPPIAIGSFTPQSGSAMLVAVWIAVAVAAGGFILLTKGRTAARLETLRTTPLTAALIGIDGGRLRLISFLCAAAMAGAAGALQAHHLGVVSPAVTSFDVMVVILTMAVVGGRGSLVGAIIGALLLVQIPEWFRFLEQWYLLAYGALLLAVMVLAPKGLAGQLSRFTATNADPSATPSQTIDQPTSSRTAALTVSGVSKRFGGVQALSGVDLAIEPGSIHGLIGPNGSGKTTLLNVICGLESTDAGEVRLAATSIGALRAHRVARLGVGRSLQHPEFPPDISALDIVRAATPSDLDEASAGHLAWACLADMDLAMIAASPATSLSPAERRRLDISRALATRPATLLLDEPAAGLSEVERGELAVRLKSLAAKGMGLLVIEHSMDFLLPLADVVTCLAEGRVIAFGKPDHVARDAIAVAAYFGSPAP
jgi:branched-chain amino acid transport system permease protein